MKNKKIKITKQHLGLGGLVLSLADKGISTVAKGVKNTTGLNLENDMRNALAVGSVVTNPALALTNKGVRNRIGGMVGIKSSETMDQVLAPISNEVANFQQKGQSGDLISTTSKDVQSNIDAQSIGGVVQDPNLLASLSNGGGSFAYGGKVKKMADGGEVKKMSSEDAKMNADINFLNEEVSKIIPGYLSQEELKDMYFTHGKNVEAAKNYAYEYLGNSIFNDDTTRDALMFKQNMSKRGILPDGLKILQNSNAAKKKEFKITVDPDKGTDSYHMKGWYADGGRVGDSGVIVGEGGPTDDKVSASLKENDFIIPADAVNNPMIKEALRLINADKKVAKLKTGSEDVKLSNGEVKIDRNDVPLVQRYLSQNYGVLLEDFTKTKDQSIREGKEGYNDLSGLASGLQENAPLITAGAGALMGIIGGAKLSKPMKLPDYVIPTFTASSEMKSDPLTVDEIGMSEFEKQQLQLAGQGAAAGQRYNATQIAGTSPATALQLAKDAETVGWKTAMDIGALRDKYKALNIDNKMKVDAINKQNQSEIAKMKFYEQAAANEITNKNVDNRISELVAKRENAQGLFQSGVNLALTGAQMAVTQDMKKDTVESRMSGGTESNSSSIVTPSTATKQKSTNSNYKRNKYQGSEYLNSIID